MRKSSKKILALFIACVVVFALPCVASASDSVLVSTSDGKSYEGLPSFPTEYSAYINQTSKRYYIFDEYILYKDSGDSKYYLVCVDSENGKLYVSSSGSLASTGTMSYYDSNYSTTKGTESSVRFSVYFCGSDDNSWTFLAHYSNNSLYSNYKDTLVQSSCDIYSDDTFTSVFTIPVRDPFLLGILTPEKIMEMTMEEVVGLIPLVIGLVVLVLAFWKGYQMLHKALQQA